MSDKVYRVVLDVKFDEDPITDDPQTVRDKFESEFTGQARMDVSAVSAELPHSYASTSSIINHCLLHKDRIYVRQERAGRWYSLALSELTPGELADHIARFIERAFVPHILKDKNE